MEAYKKRAIRLLTNLAIDESQSPSVIPYVPSKTEIPKDECELFERRRATAEERAALADMIKALEEEPRANVHSILVIKGGKAILELNAPGYSARTPHLAHSMSKTVTGIGIGMLIDDGKLSLDDRVSDFFSDELPKVNSDATVYDLLSMKRDNAFAEIGVVTESEWTKAFFECDRGECDFRYNSMCSYILGRIISKVSGKSYTDFIKERLLEPLGITSYFIERGPEGYEKAGFGIYISAEGFAMIGYMLLMNGEVRGKRLLSREFIANMTNTHSIAPNDVGDYNYGLHLWVGRSKNTFLLNGMLGQNVLVIPDKETIAVITAGNNELFSGSPALSIIENALTVGKGETECSRKGYKNLRKSFCKNKCKIRIKDPLPLWKSLFGLFERRPYLKEFDSIAGEYATRENNASHFPLFASVMQNNFPGGIERIRLERWGNGIRATFTEGAVDYSVPFGLYGFEESDVNINGERYRMRCAAEVTEDENRATLYKLLIVYPELPYTRLIKITKTSEGIRLRLSEEPDNAVAERFLDSLTDNPKLKLMLSFFEKRAGESFISDKLRSAFHPELFAIDTATEGYEEIIAYDNALRREALEKNSKPIKSLLSGFLKEESNKDSEKNRAEEQKSILGRALSALFGFFS